MGIGNARADTAITDRSTPSRGLRSGPRGSPARPSRRPIRACRRRRGRGAHQARSPRRPISAGTSSARTNVASIATASAAPKPSSLMKKMSEVTNAPIATQNSSAAAVTRRPVRSRPWATASRAGQPVVVGLLDASEQEYAVIGREREGDDEQQHEVGLLQAADRGEAQQRREVAVLEDQHEQPRADGDRQQVHRSASTGITSEPVIRNRKPPVTSARTASVERGVRGDRGLLVDEPRRGAADQQVRTPAPAARAAGAPDAGWRPSRRCRAAPVRSPTCRARGSAAGPRAWPGRRPPLRPRATSADHARPAGRGARRPRVHHERDRLRAVDGEVAGDRFGHLAGLRGGRQHVRVGRRQREAQRGRGHRAAAAAVPSATATGAAHDRAREPGPGALSAGSRRARGVALQPGGRERVDARSERDEHGGQHDQRDGAGATAPRARRRPPSSRGSASASPASRRPRRRPPASCRAPCARRSAACARSPRGWPGRRASSSR